MASLERLGEVGLVLGGGALNPKLVPGLVFFLPGAGFFFAPPFFFGEASLVEEDAFTSSNSIVDNVLDELFKGFFAAFFLFSGTGFFFAPPFFFGETFLVEEEAFASAVDTVLDELFTGFF